MLSADGSRGNRDGSDRQLGTLAPIGRTRSLSDKAAEMLLEGIVQQRLKPGDRLPSERELGEQLGVSRTVIREAVRSLVAKGVVDVRTGSGLQVAAVDSSIVHETMHLYLLGQTAIDYGKLHELRAVIEVPVAALAASRASDDDIARMKQICDEMEAVLSDLNVGSDVDVAFHRAVAQSTQNELYELVLGSLNQPLTEVRRHTLGLPGRGKQALAQHRGILQAIEKRDTAAAEAAMRAHLEFTMACWQEAEAEAEAKVTSA